MFKFILVVQALVAAGLIGVILMQKSEGGGLGVGGSPAGFLSARGAADFLTRATAVLATAFVGLSILLAVVAAMDNSASKVTDEAARRSLAPASAPASAAGAAAVLPGTTVAPGAGVAGGADPLAAAAGAAGSAQPAADGAEKGVPLQK